MRLLTNNKKIYVIEPHSDDCFLSLGAHVEEWVKQGTEVTIITVYARTRKRADDAAGYSRAVRAGWIGMDYTETGGGLRSVPPDIHGNAFDFMSEVFPIAGTDTKVLIPLSVGHPEHETVRIAVEQNAAAHGYESNLLYYLDSPYMITQALNEKVNDALRGMTVVSYRKPHARKWRHCTLFRDQQRFFYFNRDRLKETFELIVAYTAPAPM